MSSAARWLDKGKVEIKLGAYGVAPPTALSDPSLVPRVQDYRRQASARMTPLGKADIRDRIPSAEYRASRKIDGEFTVLVYRDGQSCCINSGGTVRVGLPCQTEAENRLGRAGVREALVAGELYAASLGARRPRVHDVTKLARQPESTEDLERLRFAVFDLLSWDGRPPSAAYEETWKTILKVFDGGEKVHPVEAAIAKNASDVERLFQQWVEQEGAEGLVVRSDLAGWFKVKPRHTLDAVVIGFTEGTEERQGLLHDLLLAVMRRDGTFHVLSRVGGGFSEDDRRAMLSDLKDMVVESEYAEVNADHVAYQMVEPEWVIEISTLDLVSQTTRGGPFNRMVLRWNHAARRYEVIRRMPLVSVISPQFIRRREDKSVHPQDVRIQQITDLVEVPWVDRDASLMTLNQSEVLRREVYTKQLKGETMVRKFLLWQTHKEVDGEEFPAYVVHYTDFSPNRQTPLLREVRTSNSREQIDGIWSALKESNVKKGWEPAIAIGLGGEQAVQPAAPPEATAAEPVSQKKTARTRAPKPSDAESESAVAKEPTVRKRKAKQDSVSTPDEIATPPKRPKKAAAEKKSTRKKTTRKPDTT